MREELVKAFTRNRAELLGYARVLVRDIHLAEDLLQEAGLVVMRKASSGDAPENIDAFLAGIIRNLARNALRKERYIHLVPSPELAAAIRQAHDSSPGDEAMRARLDHLDECVRSLDPDRRELLVRRYREGHSLRSIAEGLARSAGSVQVALTRIRQFLLRCITKREEAAAHG